MLEKHQVIMRKTDRIARHDDTSVRYVADNGESHDLTMDLFEEMVRPLEITVTVERGDTLNG